MLSKHPEDRPPLRLVAIGGSIAVLVQMKLFLSKSAKQSPSGGYLPWLRKYSSWPASSTTMQRVCVRGNSGWASMNATCFSSLSGIHTSSASMKAM